MGSKSVIKHREKGVHMAVLRDDYLIICEGDRCSAMILNQLEFWVNTKINGNGDIEKARNGDIWIFKKQEELKGELSALFGIDKIRKSLEYLIEKGFVLRRNNPKYKWDKIYHYTLNVEAIQKALDELKDEDFNYDSKNPGKAIKLRMQISGYSNTEESAFECRNTGNRIPISSSSNAEESVSNTTEDIHIGQNIYNKNKEYRSIDHEQPNNSYHLNSNTEEKNSDEDTSRYFDIGYEDSNVRDTENTESDVSVSVDGKDIHSIFNQFCSKGNPSRTTSLVDKYLCSRYSKYRGLTSHDKDIILNYSEKLSEIPHGNLEEKVNQKLEDYNFPQLRNDFDVKDFMEFLVL